MFVVHWCNIPKIYTVQDNNFSFERFLCIWKADVKKIIIFFLKEENNHNKGWLKEYWMQPTILQEFSYQLNKLKRY